MAADLLVGSRLQRQHVAPRQHEQTVVFARLHHPRQPFAVAVGALVRRKRHLYLTAGAAHPLAPWTVRLAHHAETGVKVNVVEIVAGIRKVHLEAQLEDARHRLEHVGAGARSGARQSRVITEARALHLDVAPRQLGDLELRLAGHVLVAVRARELVAEVGVDGALAAGRGARVCAAERHVVQRQRDALAGVRLDAVEAGQVSGAAARKHEHVARRAHDSALGAAEQPATGAKLGSFLAFGARPRPAAQRRVYKLVVHQKARRVDGGARFREVLHNGAVAGRHVALVGTARPGPAAVVAQRRVVADLGPAAVVTQHLAAAVPDAQSRRTRVAGGARAQRLVPVAGDRQPHVVVGAPLEAVRAGRVRWQRVAGAGDAAGTVFRLDSDSVLSFGFGRVD